MLILSKLPFYQMSEFVILLPEILKCILAFQTPSDEESSLVLVENKGVSSPFFSVSEVWQ